MKKRIMTGSAALLIIGTAVLVVFGYNLWSYCCGHCTINTFLSPGPFGLGLLGLNVLAAAILAALKIRRRMRHSRSHCRCGTTLIENWVFCPECGEVVSPSLS